MTETETDTKLESQYLSPREAGIRTGLKGLTILLRCQKGLVPGAWQGFNGYWHIPDTPESVNACRPFRRGRPPKRSR